MSRGLLAAAFAVVLVTALLARPAARAQTGPSIFIQPAPLTVGLQGGTFTIDVMVDDVTNPEGLGGYALVMEYDPAVIEGRSIADSGFGASTGNAFICPASAIANERGRLAQFCFTIALLAEPGPRTTEPHLLARVTFAPVGTGVTPLDISETTIADPQGNTLPATIANGLVVVSTSAPGVDPAATGNGTGDQGASDQGDGAVGNGSAGNGAGTGQNGTPADPGLPPLGAGNAASISPRLWPGSALVTLGAMSVAGGVLLAWLRRPQGQGQPAPRPRA